GPSRCRRDALLTLSASREVATVAARAVRPARSARDRDDGRRSGARSGAADPREALRGAADARGRGAGARGEGVPVGRRGPGVGRRARRVPERGEPRRRLQRPVPAVLERYPTLAMSAVAMLASVGFLAVLAAGEGFFGSLPRFTAGGWLAVLYIGIGSGGGYYLWLWALGHATPTQVTVFLALSPVTATVLGATLL